MKILIFGPKDRYDLYRPDFSLSLPVELAFSSPLQSTLQASRANPDAEVVFADAITPVGEEIMDALPKLKLIHSEGVAFNAIDLDAARERGIFVCNNKGCNAVSVAEHTVMLMLMALRCGVTGHHAVLAGEQIQFKEQFMLSNAPELGEQTVGLIGLGDIGTATARLLRPFGCKLHYYTAHRRPPETEEVLGLTFLPLEELASSSSILSLHCAVNKQTTNMINQNFLTHVKPGTILVNTARGQLVDNEAVRQALMCGRLGGIAMDTFDPEPTPADHPLVDLPIDIADRAVFSPHLGGITGGSFRRAHSNMWHSVKMLLEGQRPNFIVNSL